MSDGSSPLVRASLRKWIILVALLGYAGVILYLFYFVGIGELISVLARINIIIYLFAIASLIIAYTAHTLVWFQLLKDLSIKLSFRRTLMLYWTGVFVDDLIPGGWSGDLFKAYLLNKDPTVQSGKAVASVVAKNMYEAVFNIGNMLLGVGLILLNYSFEGSLLLTLGVIMTLLTLPLVILMIASFRPNSAKKVIAALFRFLSYFSKKRERLDSLQSKINKALSDYHEGIQLLLSNRRMLLKPTLLSLFAWASELITLIFVFASLGQIIPTDKVIIVHAISGNIPQGYAFTGYSQIIITALYNALGVNLGLAASVALLDGVLIFWIKTGISYAAFHYTVFSPRTRLNNTVEKETQDLAT